MANAEATSWRSLRSPAPLTDEHLCRLAALADADHALFTRSGGRPEYQSRRLVVVLAQGAACHYLRGRAGDRHSGTGIKDLDVWTFYSAVPSRRFPANRRETHADFGPSVFGRQLYDLGAARDPRERARWQGWSAYRGRRVDFLMRALPVPVGAPIRSVAEATQDWLIRGAQNTAPHKPSAWHLANKAMVLLYPASCRGDVIWPPGWDGY